MSENSERVICTDSGCSAADMAALLNNCNGNNNPAALMAMMNNNNAWGGNNPMLWLVWLYAMRWMNMGNWENGEGALNWNNRAISQLQNTVDANHINDVTMQAIQGNGAAIHELAQALNTDFNTISQAVCGVKSAIETVGGQVGYSAEKVINAVNLGDSGIIQAIQNTACATQKAIIEQGYQNQLQNERQTGILGSKMDQNHAADQLQNCQSTSAIVSRIDQLANGVQTGFANLGFQNERNTASVIQNATANTQRILDQMCANSQQELRDKLAQMSQEAQTQTIINQLRNSGCGCGC